MPPLVSIIIPTYNYAHYLVHAIESALAQTHPNIEVIVIDDGSTDHTAEVVKPFHDRIQYRHKENGGLSAARNTGIQAATGDYLVFLDADDLLDSNVIEKSLKALTQHPSAPGCVCQNEQFVEVPGDYSKRFGWHLPDAPDLDVLMLFRNIAPPHAYMIQKEKAMQMTFDTELKACEDYDYWFRYFSTFGAPVRSDGLVYYRRHNTSMSANLDRQYYYDVLVQNRITQRFLNIYRNGETFFGKTLSPQNTFLYSLALIAAWLLTLRNSVRAEIDLPVDANEILNQLCQLTNQSAYSKKGLQELPIGIFIFPIKRYARRFKPALKEKLPKLPRLSSHHSGKGRPQPFHKRLIADISWLFI